MTTLIIADDDEDILYILYSIFTADGYTVWTAADGEQALQLTRRHRPDAVLTDVAMPGMDGLQLCQAIRDDPLLRDTPVALLSGVLSHNDDEAVMAAGPCSVYLKPRTHVELLDAVRGLVNQGRHSHDEGTRPCLVGATW